MSEEKKIEDLEFVENVIKTGSADTQGVYSRGNGVYVQFEGGALEGPPADGGDAHLPKVGIYHEPGTPQVVAITPDPKAVFRGPGEPKPQDALRNLTLRKIKDPNELNR